jgi:ATP-dependent RNA helicase RhlE
MLIPALAGDVAPPASDPVAAVNWSETSQTVSLFTQDHGVIRALAKGLLHDPLTVEVAARNAPAELVEHRVHLVEQGDKRAVLRHLLREGATPQTLVFTRTKHGANRLAEQLSKDGIECAAIHGNKSQNARTKALADFKDYKVQVLVATDIAARGLDITELPQVVNYELPHVPEDYVHRIGRTGRAGATGQALSLVADDERDRPAYSRIIGKPCKDCGNMAVIKKDGCEFCTACGAIGACG